MLTPQPGQIVRVRSRQYLVEAVSPPPSPRDAHLVSLSCVDDDSRGTPLEVLWESEPDARLLDAPTWASVASRGFDAPHLFSAYLHTLRWSTVTATDPKRFQAPFRAGIEVKAYQLEPLRKALMMPRVNLFIADDVGLGKTIEAGLILREMMLRNRIRRVVICAPPSVVRQWHEEMEQRFGLTFAIYDRDYVAARRQERGFAINPFSTHSRFILSHALIRDEAHAGPLRDWLNSDANGLTAPGTLLILDEAHNVAPASGSLYAVDSRLTRAIRDLAPRFEHKLFLSATPHNGHSNSFSALLELLDPQKFCRGVPVTPSLRDEVMVRRLKSDLRDIGETFPERKVVRIDIDNLPEDTPELTLSRLLQRYRTLREERLASLPAAARATGLLVIISLQKRLLSSIEAFARTLAVHRAALARATAPIASAAAPRLEFDAPDADDERAELSDEELEAADKDTMTRASTRTAPPNEADLAILHEMAAIAADARYRPDTRIQHLIGWVRANLCPTLGAPNAAWSNRRVIIFTEYADTKRYLVEQLTDAVAQSNRAETRIGVFHGGTGDDAREAIKAAFNADPDHHPLRILIATDAAREGLNLQNHCADLFHFDIPWNPGRLEQRNGRIDRKLQRAAEVRCHYYVLSQRPEDRVLDVLVRKTELIHKQLGSLSPVLERRIDGLVKGGAPMRSGRNTSGGLAHSEIEDLFATLDAIDPDAPEELTAPTPSSPAQSRTTTVAQELETTREPASKLAKQVAQLEALLETSRTAIGLDAAHFRAAIDASLEVLGAPGLVRGADSRFTLPALSERLAADPGWTATLDTLRAPRKKHEKPWEWRKNAPIRPVVFSDPGTLDGEVVHLHLEHRLVQRLLGRFVSQGFIHDELTRAAVLIADVDTPTLAVLGRISLYGDAAARLHDELIAVTAPWTPPDARRGALKPETIAARDDTLARIEAAFLEASHLPPPSDTVIATLRQAASRDVEELATHLTRRAEVVTERAKALLDQRAEAEAEAMKKILEAQRRRILARQGELAANRQQLALLFNREEQRQLEADERHWSARLVALADEIDREPARIRETYTVKADRLEPVGLVYLWPKSAV